MRDKKGRVRDRKGRGRMRDRRVRKMLGLRVGIWSFHNEQNQLILEQQVEKSSFSTNSR